MEVDQHKSPAWLLESHPNYIRWERARNLSLQRGDLVFRLLKSNKINTSGIRILDLGSGEGGTSNLFSKNNFLVSLDISLNRLSRQKDEESFNKINGDAEYLPFKDDSFDLIIMQDVIEHVYQPKKLINGINRILKKNGNIYLSTPNRFSIFNIVADPHWGLPLLSLFKRNVIKKYFLQNFRKNETGRKDIAELYSLPRLKKLFTEYYSLNLCTNESLELLFNGHKGIVWSNFHLRLIKIIKILNLAGVIKTISNNRFGLINIFFTPTFYIILNRKQGVI